MINPIVTSCPQPINRAVSSASSISSSSETDLVSKESKVERTVLVIEDEPAIREAVVEILSFCDIKVFEAGKGQQGTDIYAQSHNEIGAVLLDMQLPDMDGKMTLKLLRELNPSVKVIISSGADHSTALEQFPNKDAISFLPKPYEIDNLIDTVQSVLDA